MKKKKKTKNEKPLSRVSPVQYTCAKTIYNVGHGEVSESFMTYLCSLISLCCSFCFFYLCWSYLLLHWFWFYLDTIRTASLEVCTRAVRHSVSHLSFSALILTPMRLMRSFLSVYCTPFIINS